MQCRRPCGRVKIDASVENVGFVLGRDSKPAAHKQSSASERLSPLPPAQGFSRIFGTQSDLDSTVVPEVQQLLF